MIIEGGESFLFETLITDTSRIMDAVGYGILKNDPEIQIMENKLICSFFKVDRSLVFKGARSSRRRARLREGYPRYHLIVDWGNLSLGRFPRTDLHADFSLRDIQGGSRQDIQKELRSLGAALEELSGSYPAELVNYLKGSVQLQLSDLEDLQTR